MAVPLSPLNEATQKKTANEIIRDRLASMIASGVLQVGDELPSERELAAMLSVSRETVRGAVQRLAGEGVVLVSQGARTRFAKVDVEIGTQRIGVTNPGAINGYGLEAVHEARLLVETAVVADAARNLGADAIARLDDSIAAQEQACDDLVRFLICDREFHLTIYYACANRLLADFVVDLYYLHAGPPGHRDGAAGGDREGPRGPSLHRPRAEDAQPRRRRGGVLRAYPADPRREPGDRPGRGTAVAAAPARGVRKGPRRCRFL